MRDRVLRAVLRIGAIGTALAGAGPAFADDMFDVAFGAALTSDYISRGIAQANHNPAIQGYVEFDPGIFYAGVWASNVDFAGTKDTEIDLSAGIRPEWGKFSFDLGYVHYLYANDPTLAYGEAYVIADYAVNDTVSIGGDVYFAPDFAQSGSSATYGEFHSEISLPHDFSIDGAVGYQSFASALGLPNYVTWNVGLKWAPIDWATVEVRYSDSNLDAAECDSLMAADACGARVSAMLSLDTSWSALKGGK